MSIIKLIGDAPNQVSRNRELGDLAFQDAANIAGNVGVGGALTVQAGTAALPSITPTGDTNTGVFFPAADTIAFSEGGAEVMRINSAGNVGVGTTAPNCLLYVANSTNPSTVPALGAASTHFAIGNLVSYGTMFGALSSGNGYIQQQRFDGVATAYNLLLQPNGGNVGIGVTPNASALLDVQSTTKGVRMPNMTTTQKNAIASPAAGLMVFDTTLSKLSVYSGVAWETITSV